MKRDLTVRRTGHRDPEAGRGRIGDRGVVPTARHQRANLLCWNAKYGGMESGDGTKLNQLEEENRKLKQSCAEGRFLTRNFQHLLDFGQPPAMWQSGIGPVSGTPAGCWDWHDYPSLPIAEK